jgi:hypothetical protein
LYFTTTVSAAVGDSAGDVDSNTNATRRMIVMIIVMVDIKVQVEIVSVLEYNWKTMQSISHV